MLQSPRKRKVSNLLALAVLALLRERPMHPYEMAAAMRERGTEHNMNIKWGSLYTVVGNLEKHGFIAATETSRQGRRPERTVYAITDLGEAELTDWMRELVSTLVPEQRRFRAALSVLGVLPPAEVVELLAQRLRALEVTIAGEEASLARLSQDLPRVFLIEAEYELAMWRAEAEWVRKLLEEVRAGTLPGIELWHSFHQAIAANRSTRAEEGGAPG